MSKKTQQFSKVLKEKMKNQNIWQSELARRIDVSDTTISRYIKGETKPKPMLLERLAETLNCSTDDLYKY